MSLQLDNFQYSLGDWVIWHHSFDSRSFEVDFLMNKKLDEKALADITDEMVTAFTMTSSIAPGDNVARLKAGLKAAIEATQAGESEPVAWQVKLSSGNFGTIFHGFDKPIGDARALYAAPPSLAAVQAENERLRNAIKICLKAERERRNKLKRGASATPYTDARIRMLEDIIEEKGVINV